MLRLSKNDLLTRDFRLKEFCVSGDHPYLVDNLYLTVSKHTESLFLLCHLLLQPIRDKFGVPLHISSGYRDVKLNAKVGGSLYSLHLKGKAADIWTDDKKVLSNIFRYVLEEKKGQFGELLLYKTEEKGIRFLHISLPEWGRGVNIDDEVIK
jgi:hypothetical protein